MSIQLPTDAGNTGISISTTDLSSGVPTGAAVENVRLVGALAAQFPTVATSTPAAADYALSVRAEALGAQADAAAATDTSTASNIGMLKRVAQRLSSLIALLPTALTGNGNLKVCISEDLSGSTIATDNGTVAAAQANVALVLSMLYSWTGSAWQRGGATMARILSAASTNATSVKGSAGVLYSISVTNTNAAARYLKLYDKASAPTVGTDVPKWTITIPGATTGAGNNPQLPPMGLAFASGIAAALTTGVADADTGAVGANDILVNLSYL